MQQYRTLENTWNWLVDLRAKTFVSFHILIIGEYLYYLKNLRTKNKSMYKVQSKGFYINVYI